MPAIVYRCTGNARCHKTTFFALETDMNPYCSFVLFFFSHSLGCLSCGCKEMCDYPCRKPLDETRAMNSIGFKKLMYSRRLRKGVSQKHLPSRELLEFAKIRNKSLDIETIGQRSSDSSLGPAKKPNLVPRGSKDDTETINKSSKVSTKIS